MELMYEGCRVKGSPKEIYELVFAKRKELAPSRKLETVHVRKYVKIRVPKKFGVVPITAKGFNYNWTMVYGRPVVQRVRELRGEGFKDNCFEMFRHLIREAENRGFPLNVDERLVLQRTVQAAYSFVKNKG